MILNKMNEVVHKFLLLGYKFITEIHLKQHELIYSACEPFTKHKQEKKLQIKC